MEENNQVIIEDISQENIEENNQDNLHENNADVQEQIEVINEELFNLNDNINTLAETTSNTAIIAENIVGINKNLNIVVILLTILIVWELMKLRGEKR